MTTRAEDVLYSSLTDIDALEQIAKIGLRIDAVPTEELRPMVKWALDYYFESGRRQAPSREMLNDTWGELLEDLEVELIDESEEADTIESALDAISDHFAHHQWQQFIKRSSTDMANAGPTEKVETLTEVTNQLFALTASLQDHSNRQHVEEGFAETLARYQVRATEELAVRGMTFGLDAVDQHTYGIHPGEMAILAAGPKLGKSTALVRIALHEWATRSRRVALFTLENSVEMTYDRLICFKFGLPPRAWQRGQVPAEKVEEVETWVNDELRAKAGSLHVIQSPRGTRTPEMMIREARLLGAETVLVDQLTHVEHPDPGRKPRHELFNENVHEFADLVKSNRDPVSLLLAHQINRAGVENSKKINYLEMQHMAESAGVERAADWVFGLHQSPMERIDGAALLQILAARREDTNNWQIAWDPTQPTWSVSHAVSLEDRQ